MANFGASGGSFGGSSVGAAFLRLTLDDASYRSRLNGAQSQTVAAASKMGTSFQQLQKFARQALGALGAVEVLRRSITAYDEQVKAVARLNLAFSNSPTLVGASTDAFIEQASALSKLTGVQDEAIIGAQAALSVFGLTEDQLRRLTPLVLDYAAFTGTDATAAATAMGRAVLGNARALKTIGIDFTRTGNLAADFETVMALVADKVGGAAEAMATPMDRMRVAVDEAFESIGEFLAPSLEGLASVLGKVPAPLTAVGVGLALMATQGKQAALTFAKWLGPILLVTEGLAILGDALEEDADFLGVVGNELERVVGFMGVDLKGSPVGAFLQEYADANPNSAVAESLRDAQAAAEGYADATSQAAEETLNLISAQYQLAGGMLGLVESFRSSKDAQTELKEVRAELADLEAQGKKGTSEWAEAQRRLNDAQLDSVSSQLALESAVVAYEESLINGEGSRAQAIADIRAMGARAGLTKAEIQTLIDRINAIPDNSYTDIQVNNAQALAAIIEVDNYLASLPTYKSIAVAVSYGVSYGGQRAVAEGGIVGMADGGITTGAAGFITRGPTWLRPGVLVGEGRSPTPYGPGTEAVIPLDQRGKAILREVFSEVSGGPMAGGILKVYGPGDPDLIADAVVRKMARMR